MTTDNGMDVRNVNGAKIYAEKGTIREIKDLGLEQYKISLNNGGSIWLGKQNNNRSEIRINKPDFEGYGETVNLYNVEGASIHGNANNKDIFHLANCRNCTVDTQEIGGSVPGDEVTAVGGDNTNKIKLSKGDTLTFLNKNGGISHYTPTGDVIVTE